MAIRGGFVGDVDGLSVDPYDIRPEAFPGGRVEVRAEGPVLAGGEGIDLTLALDDESNGDRLDASGGEAARAPCARSAG